MPWYQRRIANMLFAAPPSSTYEEVSANLLGQALTGLLGTCPGSHTAFTVSVTLGRFL